MSSVKSNNDDLPWLVNGSLDKTEAAVVEASIEDSKALREEYEFLAALRNSVQQQSLADVPLEMSWQRLRRDIRRQHPQGVSSRWRFLAIAASLFLLVQSLVVWLPDENGARYQPLSSSVAEPGLQVQFVDSAPQARIRQLLREHHLRIIDGPSAAGLYRLASDGNRAEALAALKKQTDLIAYVQAE
jgi:anti-sigma factor RsiW